MNATDALQFLGAELQRIDDTAHRLTREQARDLREMLVLWIPPLLKMVGVEPMDDFRASAFREEARLLLAQLGQQGGYRVNATCVECQQLSPLPITNFTDGQCRSWCDHCGGEKVFLLKTAEVTA